MDKQSTDEYQSRQRDNTIALAKLLGRTLTQAELNDGSFYIPQAIGKVSVSANSVRFYALDVPVDASLKIAEIIVQIKAKQ